MHEGRKPQKALVATVICLSVALAAALYFLFRGSAGAAGGAPGAGFFTGYPIFDETMVEMAWPAVESRGRLG